MWKLEEDGILYHVNPKPSNKPLACFDLVVTLIQPIDGDITIRGRKWIWTFDSVPSTLNEWKKEGYRIILFSNHRATKTVKQKNIDEAMDRMELFFQKLGFKPDVFISMNEESAK